MLDELEIKTAISSKDNDIKNKLNIYNPEMFKDVGKILKVTLKSEPVNAINILCIGYLVDNKIISWYNIQKFLESIPAKNMSMSLFNTPLYMYKVRDTNKIRIIKSTDIFRILGEQSITKIVDFLSIKTVGFEISAKVFGLKTSKQSILGNIFPQYTLEYGKSKKLNADTYYVTIPYKDINIKFCLCDIEFIFPNFKGYNFPKDRSFSVGKQVRYKKSDKCNSQILTIVNVKINKHNYNNSVITVFDGEKNKKMYIKNLKVIC